MSHILKLRLRKGDNMKDYTRELTKDQWDRYWKGELDKSELHSEEAICGYGVYWSRPYEKDGKYYLPYSMGSSCD